MHGSNAPFRRLLTTSCLGALIGFAFGCVIDVNSSDPKECGDPLTHSHVVGDACVCDDGYQWEEPNDPNNFECEPLPSKDLDCGQYGLVEKLGGCICPGNLVWCNPDDPNDPSCCEAPKDDVHGTGDGTGDPSDGTTGETGDTGVDDSTGPDPGVEPDPADCTEDGLQFCSHTEDMGPEGSRYWTCMGGQWVEDPTFFDVWCQSEGDDFGIGCTDSGDASEGISFWCGNGPGTPCSGDEATCADSDLIQYCQFGKLHEDSCLEICQTEGDGRQTFDFGECIDDMPANCFCCDQGEDDCPV